ncbi:hypothetical protein F0562_035142 [Nyssa sinensis]|uniref:Endonuclease/exonuclease/phosphatase domain-containing protein n=1 Tax=Nyssa sinensis TaxID=561372 RepID=A0A5J5ACP5_9ASTE|nr:hypothetical protein F0562_035142 [Nyssa sinensis]
MLKGSLLLPRLPPVSSFRSGITLGKMSTTRAPSCPKFIPVEQTEISSIRRVDGFKFSLVSYNVLAQVYVKSALFPHSPSACLKWKARSQAILTVLKSLGTDFLCLQELDEYDSFYKGNMENHGYSSIYIQRSGQKRDGCGIFYKHKSAELVLEEKIEYNDLVNSIQDETTLYVDKDDDALTSGNKDSEPNDGLVDKETHEDPNDPCVRLKRDCVGIMGAFKLKDPSQHLIIVANTHIYWDPEWADVKLAQAKYLLLRLAQFKTLVSDKLGCTPAVIVAGDFNSTPGDKVYQYLISGSSTMGPRVECSEDLPIPLQSVYASTRGEPQFTNVTPGFTDTATKRVKIQHKTDHFQTGWLDFLMAIEVPLHHKFEVNFTNKSIVKAIDHPLPDPPILTLSNLDLLSGRFPVTYFYFYRRPLVNNFTSILEALKSSLALTLNHFFPFAGRIVQNPNTSEPEIICDNNGALVVEAHANIPLRELNFYDLNQSLQGKLVSINHDFPLQIQVTRYTCGGISITFTFDHALADASAFGKFLVTWSEIAINKPISCIPDHRRYLRARSPPTYDPSLDKTFVTCTMEDIINMPTTNILLKRLYHIDVSSINRLQRLACIDGSKRTKIEAFSAYIWKIMVRAIGESHKHCKMGWLIDGRTRMCKDQNLMSNYIGNVLSLGFGEASVVELKEGSISDVARIVQNAISQVTNEAHFLDLIDWIECHRPGLMLSKIVLGRGGPAVVVSSGRRFPVAELDFGFGSPVLGTVCSTIERIGVGYINQRQSARGDGSWTVSAILWPELAAAIESDSDHVFQPMYANHLQL